MVTDYKSAPAGEMGREGEGEMGRRGDGEMGREGDGERGRWEERETGWRRFAIGARDAESDGLEDGHGLQIRAIDVCGSRITNPRHRCVRVTDCKSAPAM